MINWQIYYWSRGIQKTFLHTIMVLLEDIKKLELERKKFLDEYYNEPRIENLALFYARAKRIEQMLILGVCGEYLIKSVLIKHNFVINETNANIKFSEEFISSLNTLNNSGLSTTIKHIKEVDSLAQKNVIASLNPKTVKFQYCIDIFNKEIAKNGYFSIDETYNVSNEYSKMIYPEIINYRNAFETLRKIRNNYGHVPDSLYEEQGILPYLYNFLIFIAKKEFENDFNDLKKFEEA